MFSINMLKKATYLIFTTLLLMSDNSGAYSSLKFLSMNVYMLPRPIKWTMQSDRTVEITNKLEHENYDLIFFQEAFMSSFRESLRQNLKSTYPYSYYLDHDNQWMHFFGSGLFVLSRYPFQVLDKVYFEDCASFDCFASKGALLLETHLPNKKILQLSTTHLQAGPEYPEIRKKQFSQIEKMLKTHFQKNAPQILLGDLNVDFSDPEYSSGLKILNMNPALLPGPLKTTNARVNDCYDTPTRKLWIDHVWIDKNANIKNPLIFTKDFNFKWGDKICPGSDHYGIEFQMKN